VSRSTAVFERVVERREGVDDDPVLGQDEVGLEAGDGEGQVVALLELLDLALEDEEDAALHQELEHTLLRLGAGDPREGVDPARLEEPELAERLRAGDAPPERAARAVLAVVVPVLRALLVLKRGRVRGVVVGRRHRFVAASSPP
jgi:hypothetical protein